MKEKPLSRTKEHLICMINSISAGLRMTMNDKGESKTIIKWKSQEMEIKWRLCLAYYFAISLTDHDTNRFRDVSRFSKNERRTSILAQFIMIQKIDQI